MDLLHERSEKLAVQLKSSVCSIYIMEGEELVMAATYGFDPSFVGKIRIRIGEGITGSVAKITAVKLRKKIASEKNTAAMPA